MPFTSLFHPRKAGFVSSLDKPFTAHPRKRNSLFRCGAFPPIAVPARAQVVPVEQRLGIVPQLVLGVFQIDAGVAELLGQRIGSGSVAIQ